MEKFKFSLFLIIILILVILAGYWAFTSIESGTDHAYNQEIEKLKEENKELKNQIDTLLSQGGEQKAESQVVEEIVVPEIAVKTVSKYQVLISKLQKLIDDKVVMKKGSKGDNVGTVQEFLNVYNNTSNRPDNDYGVKTITAVKKFEEGEKLIVTEEIGSKTFQVMIDWLKKQ